MWRCQNDGLNVWVAEHVVELIRQSEAMLSSEGAYRVQLQSDAPYEAKFVAPALNGCDNIFAPPTEADDRKVDHESTVGAGRDPIVVYVRTTCVVCPNKITSASPTRGLTMNIEQLYERGLKRRKRMFGSALVEQRIKALGE